MRPSYWLLVGVDELKQLIAAADDCNVSFVYALSPGLDVVYTSTGDVAALKAKLDQVHMLLNVKTNSFLLISQQLFVMLCYVIAVHRQQALSIGIILL